MLAALSPRRLFRAVFVDQLRLRRKGSSLSIELGGPDEAPPASAAGAVAQADEPALAQCRRALGELLDARPDSRAVLRHLAALEHHLKVQQRPFFDDLSASSLQHMLRQLHGLATPPASREVALLLAELLDAVERKTAAEQTQPGVQPISSFFVDHKIEVKELDTAAMDELSEPALVAGTKAREPG